MPTHQKQPNPIDIEVGRRVRVRRNMLRMSQENLAGSVGITFQQIQKYETGANRIGAGRLQAIAQALVVPPSYFFEGEAVALGSSSEVGRRVDASDGLIEFLSSAEGIALNLAFAKIGSPAVRRRLIDLVEALNPDGLAD